MSTKLYQNTSTTPVTMQFFTGSGSIDDGFLTTWDITYSGTGTPYAVVTLYSNTNNLGLTHWMKSVSTTHIIFNLANNTGGTLTVGYYVFVAFG